MLDDPDAWTALLKHATVPRAALIADWPPERRQVFLLLSAGDPPPPARKRANSCRHRPDITLELVLEAMRQGVTNPKALALELGADPGTISRRISLLRLSGQVARVSSRIWRVVDGVPGVSPPDA